MTLKEIFEEIKIKGVQPNIKENKYIYKGICAIKKNKITLHHAGGGTHPKFYRYEFANDKYPELTSVEYNIIKLNGLEKAIIHFRKLRQSAHNRAFGNQLDLEDLINEISNN